MLQLSRPFGEYVQVRRGRKTEPGPTRDVYRRSSKAASYAPAAYTQGYDDAINDIRGAARVFMMMENQLRRDNAAADRHDDCRGHHLRHSDQRARDRHRSGHSSRSSNSSHSSHSHHKNSGSKFRKHPGWYEVGGNDALYSPPPKYTAPNVPHNNSPEHFRNHHQATPTYEYVPNPPNGPDVPKMTVSPAARPGLGSMAQVQHRRVSPTAHMRQQQQAQNGKQQAQNGKQQAQSGKQQAQSGKQQQQKQNTKHQQKPKSRSSSCRGTPGGSTMGLDALFG